MSTAQIDKILNELSPQKLHAYLKKQTVDSLASVTKADPLEQLNPAVHSLGYLFILKARLDKLKGPNVGGLVEKVAVFLREFDPAQVRVAATEFHGVVAEFARLCEEVLLSPILSLAPLKAAIHRYAKSPSHLTSIHYILIEQCLLAKCYDEALGILDITIDDLDLETELTYQYYLLYFYYGAMVYIGLKQFSQAHDFCSICITAPGSACSAIQLEAYKKFILTSLILHGKMSSIPSTVSQACARAFKHLARPYEEFARSLKTPDTAMEILRTHESVFVDDKNMGLVVQVMDRLEMRRIEALKETYVTISLEDVARKVGPKDQIPTADDISRMESLILRMIDEGILTATLSSSPATVTFHDPHTIPSRAQLEQILSSISSLNTKIKSLDKQVALSKSYNAKFANKQGGGGGTRGLSPEAEGELDSGGGPGGRFSLRPERRGGKVRGGFERGPNGSGQAGGGRFPNFPFDDKMEE